MYTTKTIFSIFNLSNFAVNIYLSISIFASYISIYLSGPICLSVFCLSFITSIYKYISIYFNLYIYPWYHHPSMIYLDELDQIFCGSAGRGFTAWGLTSLMESCRPDHGYTIDSPAIINLFQVTIYPSSYLFVCITLNIYIFYIYIIIQILSVPLVEFSAFSPFPI